MECSFAAKGNTAEEAIKKATDHAKVVHADKMREMMASMSEKEMKDAMLAAIKDV